jgi:hypothetical protein
MTGAGRGSTSTRGGRGGSNAFFKGGAAPGRGGGAHKAAANGGGSHGGSAKPSTAVGAGAGTGIGAAGPTAPTPSATASIDAPNGLLPPKLDEAAGQSISAPHMQVHYGHAPPPHVKVYPSRLHSPLLLAAARQVLPERSFTSLRGLRVTQPPPLHRTLVPVIALQRSDVCGSVSFSASRRILREGDPRPTLGGLS